MFIDTEDEKACGKALMALMHRAAELALEREGIGSEACEVSLSFVSPDEIREMNKLYRGKDSATDVLSFPMYESAEMIRAAVVQPGQPRRFSGAKPRQPRDSKALEQVGFASRICGAAPVAQPRGLRAISACTSSPILLGDVVICREIAEKQAEEIGQSAERELLYLFVHSVFHLLGYDHESEDGRRAMREAEEEVLRKAETEETE